MKKPKRVLAWAWKLQSGCLDVLMYMNSLEVMKLYMGCDGRLVRVEIREVRPRKKARR